MTPSNEKILTAGAINEGAFNQPGQHVVQTTQPGAQAGMSMNPKNALNMPLTPAGQRNWSNELFGCFADTPTCLLAWCCPCMVYSQNKSRYESLQNRNVPHPSGGDMFGGDCALHCCLTYCGGFGCVLAMANRKNIRDRYAVESTGFNDLCLSWCCHPCALTQEARELELEEDVLLGKPIEQKAPAV